MKRVNAYFYGLVHGVSFRAFAMKEACELGVTGFVRNLGDGSVELVAEGTVEKLKALLLALKTKHTAARVTKVEAEWTEATDEYRDFRVVRER